MTGMPPKNEHLIGAFRASSNAIRGKGGVLVTYRTEHGTAHSGDLRKTWRVPKGLLESRDEKLADAIVSAAVDEHPISVLLPPTSASVTPTALFGSQPKLNPLLMCDDEALAAAFERLLKEPSFSKFPLSDWEFKLAADAPGVFLQWGGFTWKQRKCLREIVVKISGKYVE